MFELEEINKEINDIDDLVDCLCGKEKPTEISDHENASFHEDSSNIDSTDEDVRSHKKKKAAMVDVPVHSENWIPENVESDFSDCLMSDEERMVANSTDDEDGEQSFPDFNEENGMENPTFEIGMKFSSANSFRMAVKNQAIKDRRAIK